jgi:hypothetical protein
MKIYTIDINAKEWTDRQNANSYFCANIVINYGLKTEKHFSIPFTYGYGTQYILDSLIMLKELGYINGYTRDYIKSVGIILRTNIQTDCKKSQLKNSAESA